VRVRIFGWVGLLNVYIGRSSGEEGYSPDTVWTDDEDAGEIEVKPDTEAMPGYTPLVPIPPPMNELVKLGEWSGDEDDVPALLVSGNGYSKRVVLVAKGVPMIWEDGEWRVRSASPGILRGLRGEGRAETWGDAEGDNDPASDGSGSLDGGGESTRSADVIVVVAADFRLYEQNSKVCKK